MDGGEETLLNAIRLSEMGVSTNETLDMNGSLYIIIGYLLKGEWEDLESNF